jgi:hypothetical protein
LCVARLEPGSLAFSHTTENVRPANRSLRWHVISF